MATRKTRTSGQRSERDSIARDDRTARSFSEDRGERGMEEEDLQRNFSDGMTTVEDSDDVDFDEFQQEALPVPPKIPGWHCCWLSTQSTYDPIHKRIKMGYQPVEYKEVPGFDTHKDSSGSGLDNVVRCNEMALYKIPTAKYLKIMKHFHHDQPKASEEAIKARVEALEGRVGADKDDRQLVTSEEGFKRIINRSAARFAAD